MSAPKKRDSTMLLLEKYGDRLRQLARQSSVADEAKADPMKPTASVTSANASEPSAKSVPEPSEQPKPTDSEPKKPVVVGLDSQSTPEAQPSTIEVVSEPTPSETSQKEEMPTEAVTSSPEKQVEPVDKVAEAPKDEPVETLVVEEKSSTPEISHEASAEEVKAENKSAPAIESSSQPEQTAIADEPAAQTDDNVKAEESATPAVDSSSEPEPTKLAEAPAVAESQIDEKVAEVVQEQQTSESAQAMEASQQEETKESSEPVEQKAAESGVESTSIEAQVESTDSSVVVDEENKEETTVKKEEPAEDTPKKKSRSKKSKEAVEEVAQQASEPQEKESVAVEEATEQPKPEESAQAAASSIFSPVTSEILRVRWAMLLDRVEWTFGYSKLSNTAMKVEWDLEDGLDNVQGFTDVITLKEGEDYIDLNTKLRFTTSILARDLNAARFKPKIMTFTLYSEADGAIMGSYELDLRTIMAPGRQDQELRYKLVDEETKKTRSTTPSLVIMLKRVKWETVIGDKSESKKELEKAPETTEAEEPEEAVLEEPKDKRRERLRREQSTRRRARKDAIDAEENGGESSPSAPSSPSGSSEIVSPSGTPKSAKPRRGIKILRTNSRFETVEDVDKFQDRGIVSIVAGLQLAGVFDHREHHQDRGVKSKREKIPAR